MSSNNSGKMIFACCVPPDPSKHTNKLINEALERERKEMNAESKLLLLGAGESGKSTIIKQMKILFDENGYTEDECRRYKPVIYSNTIQSMVTILQAMNQLNIEFENSERKNELKILLDHLDTEENQWILPLPVGRAIEILWKDVGVQKCFHRSREYQLNDSAAYYFNSLDRLIQPDYIPTSQDVLRTRVKTSGIVETTFTLKKHRFRIVDVGGQRTERKKWIEFIRELRVTAVIFVCALSEFDLVLAEDLHMNRMTESLQLFRSICNNRFFRQAGMILFLNKKDLFDEKLRSSSIRLCFPEYSGPDTYDASVHYIEEQFQQMDQREKLNGNERELYIHVTCATDTDAMQFVFAAISDLIIANNLIHAAKHLKMQYEIFRRYFKEKFPTKFHLADQLAEEYPRRTKTKKNSTNVYLDECLTVGERMKNPRTIDRERKICYENFLLAEKLKTFDKKRSKKSIRHKTNVDDDQATDADVDSTSIFSSSIKTTNVDRLYQHLTNVSTLKTRKSAFYKEILPIDRSDLFSR